MQPEAMLNGSSSEPWPGGAALPQGQAGGAGPALLFC